MKKKKERLDKILVLKGIADNPSKARGLIMSGNILANEKKVEKSGTLFSLDVNIRILKKNQGWASRGGVKLSYALQNFQLDIKDKICIDLGASTGGFTDVLLANGAKHIYSIDVGKGQLSWRLTKNDKITIMDKTNVRFLALSNFDRPIDLITCDLSFISLTKALNNILKNINNGLQIIALVKPQFELEKDKIGRNGIVKEDTFRQEAIRKVSNYLISKNFIIESRLESPIKGVKGNKEYFIHAIKTVRK